MEIDYHGSFAELDASAAAGCDLCRLLRCALILDAKSYNDLVASTAAVQITTAAQWDGKIWLTVICGEVRSVRCGMQIWKWKEIFKPAEPTKGVVMMASGHESDIEKDLVLANSWLTDCLVNHKECAQDGSRSRPKRLIDVGESNGMARLVSTSQLAGSPESPQYTPSKRLDAYCALSYCWGGDTNSMKLSNENLDEFSKNIPWIRIPKTIQDAIITTRSLGIRYLWVDALCIIQPSSDDRSDWIEESSRMASIYRDAICTISATGAKDSSEGCFLEHAWKRYPLKRCFLPREGALRPVVASIPSYSLPKGQTQWRVLLNRVDHAPLHTRGWAFQERYLSSRILHWTEDGISWECETRRVSEVSTSTHGRAISERSLSGMSLRGLLDNWRDMVEEYSRRMLTNTSDKLVALSGVAKVFVRHLGDEYLAGIWRSSLLADLLWSHDFTHSNSEHRRGNYYFDLKWDVPTPYIAPTWSWASRPTSPIRSLGRYVRMSKQLIPGVEIDQEKTFVSLASNDPTGAVAAGQISLKAPLLTLSGIHSVPTAYNTSAWESSFPPGALVSVEFDFISLYDEPPTRLLCILLFSGIFSERKIHHGLVIEVVDASAKVYKRRGLLRLDLGTCREQRDQQIDTYLRNWNTIILV